MEPPAPVGRHQLGRVSRPASTLTRPTSTSTSSRSKTGSPGRSGSRASARFGQRRAAAAIANAVYHATGYRAANGPSPSSTAGTPDGEPRACAQRSPVAHDQGPRHLAEPPPRPTGGWLARRRPARWAACCGSGRLLTPLASATEPGDLAADPRPDLGRFAAPAVARDSRSVERLARLPRSPRPGQGSQTPCLAAARPGRAHHSTGRPIIERPDNTGSIRG